MRIAHHDSPPGYQFVPLDSLAATILGFLHAGDLLSARQLTPRRMPSPDDGLALVVGYQFARCHDERLDEWSREVVEAWPDSFDAHLLRGWAVLRLSAQVVRAAESFEQAARHGLPVVSSGLRLFDHGLRLLSQGRGRPDLEALRRRYLPYLRSAFDTAVTSFWCADPDQPALEPATVRAPSHACSMRLTPTEKTWLIAQVNRSAEAATPLFERLQDAGRRIGARILGVHTVRLSVAGVRDAHGHFAPMMLDLPPDLEAMLGGAALGTISRTTDEITVLLANVDLARSGAVRFGVAIDEQAVIELEWLTPEVLVARIPWEDEDLPDRIHMVRLEAT
jgi:hypothetical protein